VGFWDVLGEVASYMLEQGAKSQQEFQKKAVAKLRENEKKVGDAERSDKMGNPEYARKVEEAKKKLETARQKIYTGQSSPSGNVKTNSEGQVLIGGKTIEQWDREWSGLGILADLTLGKLSSYNNSIGLYKAEMGGRIYYIGRAIEYDNGGFRKRLRDYVRDSDSARTHKSGGKMNENADRVYISILVVGDSEADVEDVKALERALIRKYAPQWNIQFNS